MRYHLGRGRADGWLVLMRTDGAFSSRRAADNVTAASDAGGTMMMMMATDRR